MGLRELQRRVPRIPRHPLIPGAPGQVRARVGCGRGDLVEAGIARMPEYAGWAVAASSDDAGSVRELNTAQFVPAWVVLEGCKRQSHVSRDARSPEVRRRVDEQRNLVAWSGEKALGSERNVEGGGGDEHAGNCSDRIAARRVAEDLDVFFLRNRHRWQFEGGEPLCVGAKRAGKVGR